MGDAVRSQGFGEIDGLDLDPTAVGSEALVPLGPIGICGAPRGVLPIDIKRQRSAVRLDGVRLDDRPLHNGQQPAIDPHAILFPAIIRQIGIGLEPHDAEAFAEIEFRVFAAVHADVEHQVVVLRRRIQCSGCVLGFA